MNKEKVLNILGLAQRAGRLLSGDFAVERSMKRQAYPLLIMAEDCAQNNANKYRHLAESHQVPLRLVGTKEELGRALGKEMRAVILVNDAGFAKSLLAEIDKNQ